MSNDTVVGFDKPEEVKDVLTEVLREGAMRLLSHRENTGTLPLFLYEKYSPVEHTLTSPHTIAG